MDGARSPEREERLMALLRDLVEEAGRGKAAEQLGVDRKTLWRCLRSGRLTPRLAGALEGRLPAVERTATAQLRERVTVLDRRLEAQAEELHAGVDKLRAGVEALGRAQAEALAQWERRLARVEASRTGGDGTARASPPPVKGAAPQVIGQRPAVERPWRYYPELVTRVPEPGEELVYGEATPVIVRWRAALAALRDSTRQLDRFDAEERVLELEIILLGEHGLTLPPVTYAWDDADRRHAVWKRKDALKALQTARDRALKLRRVRRVLTLGLWWN